MFQAIDRYTRFDRWGPAANPLIRRTLNQATPYRLRTLLWIGFAGGLAGTLLLTDNILHTTHQSPGVGTLLLAAAGWALAAFAPLITSSTASFLASQERDSEQFQLLSLTPISNETLVRGLVFQALYRMRVLYTVLLVLLPFMVLPVFHLAMGTLSQLNNYYSAYDMTPSYTDGVAPALIALTTAAGLLGANGIGAAAGIRMALLGRNPTYNALATPFMTLLIMLIPSCACCGASMMLGPSLGSGDGDLLLVLLAIGWPLAMFAGPLVLTHSTMHHTAWSWRR